MSRIDLPPYGVFPGFLERAAAADTPMSDWRPALPEAQRIATFVAWREQMRDRIAETVWPWFDRESRTWVGSAAERSTEMTNFELGVMVAAFQGENPTIRAEAPVGPSPEFGTTQREQFVVEDDVEQPIGVNVGDYVSSLSQEEIARTIRQMTVALVQSKLRGLFWLKRALCRPRPYQTAMLLGMDDFAYVRALSATHSSIYSGHCVEGVLASCAVFDRWRTDPRFTEDDIDRLGAFAVDFGDRRVFAGVHYPSDNVVSWAMARSLIPELFREPAPVLAFLERSLTRHSLVYRTIRERYAGDAAEGVLRLLGDPDAGT